MLYFFLELYATSERAMLDKAVVEGIGQDDVVS